MAYLNFADLLAVIEQIPNVSDDPDFQTAQGVLEGLDYLVLGSRREGDVDLLRVVLGLQGGD
jgi:hypothetical protein